MKKKKTHKTTQQQLNTTNTGQGANWNWGLLYTENKWANKTHQNRILKPIRNHGDKGWQNKLTT